jgi:predicted  nucleic acid-binding Zn-ribbon protein
MEERIKRLEEGFGAVKDDIKSLRHSVSDIDNRLINESKRLTSLEILVEKFIKKFEDFVNDDSEMQASWRKKSEDDMGKVLSSLESIEKRHRVEDVFKNSFLGILKRIFPVIAYALSGAGIVEVLDILTK